MAWFSKFLTVAVLKSVVQILPQTVKATKEWWRGKNIAIIGATASGKNAMFDMLQGKKVSEEHNQTRGVQDLETFKLSYALPNDKINFTLKKCKNVGGEEDQRELGNWKEACKDSDIIFYLIDVKKLIENPNVQKQRIKDDLRWLGENIPAFQLNKACHIFLNKVDLLLDGIDVDKQEDFLLTQLREHIDELDIFAQKILGRYYDRITGIHPISMLDKYTFNIYFSKALIDIVGKVKVNE